MANCLRSRRPRILGDDLMMKAINRPSIIRGTKGSILGRPVEEAVARNATSLRSSSRRAAETTCGRAVSNLPQPILSMPAE